MCSPSQRSSPSPPHTHTLRSARTSPSRQTSVQTWTGLGWWWVGEFGFWVGDGEVRCAFWSSAEQTALNEQLCVGWAWRGRLGSVQELRLHNRFFHNNNHLTAGLSTREKTHWQPEQTDFSKYSRNLTNDIIIIILDFKHCFYSSLEFIIFFFFCAVITITIETNGHYK